MILCEVQSAFQIRRGWMLWIFLHLRISGTDCLFTVHQPPAASAALGRDVVLPCQLRSSPHVRMGHPPVLYWEHLSHRDCPKLWPVSEGYKGRVERLDNNSQSANMSILLKHVQWADAGKYQCKLSIHPEKMRSFRKKGNETLLTVYDNLTFNLSKHNHSLLLCEVNVSHKPGCVLSVLHNGCRLPTVASARGPGAGSANVTLSERVSLRGAGKYECWLHVNQEVVAKSVLHYQPPGPGGGGENVTTCSSMLSGVVVVSPEPWLLYVGLLLVPITFLLGILTARVLCKA
ncbi:uncharacterized protein LOC114842790 [Betta splendens]|uniref:Uncharacterized protein LOC114842790 n=1 Tax=Betta splendens TaxID=158456 RepID=A0A6P7KV86_BETSP|nr:uncharacterized protein LOC114842790 [Betta splendens]XP_028984494.1 uncharacterized protein LOC114842790 [Betta splendens]